MSHINSIYGRQSINGEEELFNLTIQDGGWIELHYNLSSTEIETFENNPKVSIDGTNIIITDSTGIYQFSLNYICFIEFKASGDILGQVYSFYPSPRF